jgi:prophage regulatory protein
MTLDDPKRKRCNVRETTAVIAANRGSAVHSVQESGDNRTVVRLLRFPELKRRTGLSRSTIWRLEQTGEFPGHFHTSSNTVAWLESDVVAWIEAKLLDGGRYTSE